MTDRDYSILSTNALLDYWNEYERNTTQSTIMVYGKIHRKLHYTEMDQLCEWVLQEREKMVMVFLCIIYKGIFFIFHYTIIVHQVQVSGQHHGSLILILHRKIRIF